MPALCCLASVAGAILIRALSRVRDTTKMNASGIDESGGASGAASRPASRQPRRPTAAGYTWPVILSVSEGVDSRLYDRLYWPGYTIGYTMGYTIGYIRRYTAWRSSFTPRGADRITCDRLLRAADAATLSTFVTRAPILGTRSTVRQAHELLRFSSLLIA